MSCSTDRGREYVTGLTVRRSRDDGAHYAEMV
jgi:hypothetical protein